LALKLKYQMKRVVSPLERWLVFVLACSVLFSLGLQAQPANDSFAAAWTLVGSSAATNGTTASASKEASEPNHAGNAGGRSVWFNWTAPTNGQTRLDTIGSAFNTLLAVYTGNAVGTLTQVAANNDAPGQAGGVSRLEFNAVAGVMYRIAVDANRAGPVAPAGGNYALRLEVLASVNITSPTNGSVIYAGAPISLTAEASVTGTSVTRVDFYRGTNLIDSDAIPPYGITLTSTPLGTNLFSVVAMDDNGLNWTSPVVRVAFLNLGVTIWSPLEGAILQNTNPITVAAVASLPSGTITNVEFFVDEQKFGQDATVPFQLQWIGVIGGVHRLTVVGRDNGGILYTSSPVTISVPRLLLATGAIWKYLDDGSDQGTNWTAPDFNDSAWASGPGEFGYGDGDEATTVGFGPDPNNKHITTYFRREFFLTNAADYASLLLRVKRDDGAVIYVNGVEVQRLNMPSGVISNQSLASLAGDDGGSFYSAAIAPGLFVEGRNVLAAEVHQNSPTTDDLSFDGQLQGLMYPQNEPPFVAVTSPTNRAALLLPPTLKLTANATDTDGSVTKVAFFANGEFLGESTQSPFEFVWNTPPVGFHVLRAYATDNRETGAGSEPIAVGVHDSTGTPLARITSPANGAAVEGPTSMLVTADASAIGGVTNVQFLANGTVIGDDAIYPHAVSWNAPFGSNALVAVAFGADGRRGTSSVVNVAITVPVTNTIAPTIATRSPTAGSSLTNLSTIRVTFSERVSGVDASDLLVNGVPATQVSGSGSNYLFTAVSPGVGTVTVAWAAGHGIADFGFPASLPFDESGPGASWTYSLVDRIAPVITMRNPAANAVVLNFTQVAVTFSEPVSGVDAVDFLVNGTPATGLNGAGSNYVFSFSQPPPGPVSISWAASHGIADLAATPNPFVATNAAATWNYIVDELIPPTISSVNPSGGTHVTNVIQVTVTFSEPVSGVNASDLRINGAPAVSVTGSNAVYTFAFAQPNAALVNFTWSANHGIRDLAPSANAFDGAAPSSLWSYTTIDNVPPSIRVDPPPSATVRKLTRINLTFDEPVSGVNAGDLLINNVPAQQVSGAGAGLYTFDFSRPPTGIVQVAFASGHGVYDLVSPSNAFGGGTWTYEFNPAIVTDIAVSHAVQISLDGLGAKYLERYVNDAPGQFPNFVRLMAESAYTFNARCDYDISETVPNHASMFTARPVFQPADASPTTHHGYNNNFPTDEETFHNAGNLNVPYKSSMFDVAHDYGRSTAFYAGKTRLMIARRSYDTNNGAADLVGADNGRDKIDLASVLDISGAAIAGQVDSLIQDLASAAPKDYTFIHIAEPDLTGHGSGWGSANWSNAVRLVDTQIGRIIDAIDANPRLLNQTALIVTADHGGGGVTANGHTESYHITNYTIPFFLRAPGIPGGADLYEIFANRADPGANRTDYTTRPQPIRNGDGSNLALTLLALPPIPGSFMLPFFATPATSLRIARFEDRLAVFWSDPDNEYLLEAAESLGPSVSWQPINQGIVIIEATKVFTITAATGNPIRYFRLRERPTE